MSFAKPGRLRNDLLYRLRWNVFDTFDKIEIQDGLEEDGTERRSSFATHPIAAESIAQPPLSRIQVVSGDCSEARSYRLVPESYPLDIHTVENADGSPLTVRDFVIGVKRHLNKHKPLITGVRLMTHGNPELRPTRNTDIPLIHMKPNNDWDTGDGPINEPPPVPIFFHLASGDELVIICTWAAGEMGVSEETFWARQRSSARYFQDLETKREMSSPIT